MALAIHYNVANTICVMELVSVCLASIQVVSAVAFDSGLFLSVLTLTLLQAAVDFVIGVAVL